MRQFDDGRLRPGRWHDGWAHVECSRNVSVLSRLASDWLRPSAPARIGERATDWRGTVIFEGCGHWIQQQRVAETNAEILGFLARLNA